MRCAAAGRTSALPTSVRGPSLYATGSVHPYVRSIEVWNTTTTAVAVALAIASATGTQGTGLTEVCLSDPSKTPVATVFNTHTADATVGAAFRQATLGSNGAVIWTWSEGAFMLDNATTNGVVIILPTGTAQHLDFSFEWDE